MSCACEHLRMSREEERIRRLAKAWAVAEQTTVAFYRKGDGSYSFADASAEIEETILEYILPY